MTRLLTVVACIGLGAVALAGCDPSDGSAQDCSAEAIASLVVRVVDEKDQPVSLPPGTVTFTVDGGETRTVEAEFETIDNPVVVYSGAGLHAVTVAPSGYEPGEVEVEVEPTEDGCHVVTQELELVLETDAG